MGHTRKRSHERPTIAPATRPDRRGGRHLGYWITITVAALAFRIILLAAPLFPTVPLPIFAGMLYPGDHDDFVRWGIQATDRGVLSLYDEPPARHDMRTFNRSARTWHVQQRGFDRVCNYPPLSAYLLSLSGVAFKACSADRLINTPISLTLFTFWSVLGDFLLAWGCAALIAHFRPGWAGRTAYALLLFVPPFWWDSVVWAQMDSVLMAPAVWMVYAMVRNRWLLAGVLWGIAFGLKPHAVLFIPLWGYALVTTRPRWKPVLGGVVTLTVLLMIALPFTLHSGLKWWRLSYVQNLFAIYANLTTLKAFNFWYLHLLLVDSIDAYSLWLGLTRNTWGKISLLLSLLVTFAYTVWRWRHDRRAFVLWTTTSLLLFVMVPTEVHERYLILVLPFLAVAVAFAPRFWPGLVLLLIALMGQLSWPLWLRSGRGTWPEMRSNIVKRYEADLAKLPAGSNQQPPDLEQFLTAQHAAYRQRYDATAGPEWAFTICALLGSAAVLAAFLTLKPADAAPVARTAQKLHPPRPP